MYRLLQKSLLWVIDVIRFLTLKEQHYANVVEQEIVVITKIRWPETRCIFMASFKLHALLLQHGII